MWRFGRVGGLRVSSEVDEACVGAGGSPPPLVRLQTSCSSIGDPALSWPASGRFSVVALEVVADSYVRVLLGALRQCKDRCRGWAKDPSDGQIGLHEVHGLMWV